MIQAGSDTGFRGHGRQVFLNLEDAGVAVHLFLSFHLPSKRHILTSTCICSLVKSQGAHMRGPAHSADSVAAAQCGLMGASASSTKAAPKPAGSHTTL